MIQHEVIIPFSNEWWSYNIITILIIITTILIGKKTSFTTQRNITLGIAIFFILEFLIMDWYHLYINTWSIKDSLPLHLCGIMWFVTIYMLLFKKQWAFEMMLFIGMPGGLHSLLTPELTHGNSILHKVDFFIGHGGLVLAPFYAIFVLNMWPRNKSWIISFFKLQILVFFVGLFNFFFDSNYMYLAYPPIADHPLIPNENSFFGRWPYYIIIFEFAVFMHALIINYLLFLTKKAFKL